MLFYKSKHSIISTEKIHAEIFPNVFPNYGEYVVHICWNCLLKLKQNEEQEHCEQIWLTAYM